MIKDDADTRYDINMGLTKTSRVCQWCFDMLCRLGLSYDRG